MKNLTATFIVLFLTLPCLAEGTRNTEFGIGLGSQVLADYRGSSRYKIYALPVPYFLFEGRFLKSDKRGVRGELWANEKYELNLSADGSVNGGGDDNPLRKGMSELESAAEIGPSFNVNLTGPDFSDGWALRLPVRGVFSVSKHGIGHIGNLFNPRLTWRKPNFFMGWRATLNLGLLIADQQYHDYYYSVTSEYATEGRPPYLASGGYSGSFSRFSLYKKWESWRLKFSFRYDYLGKATFLGSPLVETKHFGLINIGLTRTLWQGKY